jgi:phosphoribosyl 1,2-cyclic phosphate phosphodiesterase
MSAIRRTFPYVFDNAPSESSSPKLEPRLIGAHPLDLLGMEFLPIPVLHGRQMILGFRFGNAAYLTDHSAIPEASLELLGGLDVLFLDALRYRPHPTHSTVDQSIRTVECLKPRRAFFTHISHDLGHERAEQLLPASVRLAYDGLQIDLEGRA